MLLLLSLIPPVSSAYLCTRAGLMGVFPAAIVNVITILFAKYLLSGKAASVFEWADTAGSAAGIVLGCLIFVRHKPQSPEFGAVLALVCAVYGLASLMLTTLLLKRKRSRDKR